MPILRRSLFGCAAALLLPRPTIAARRPHAEPAAPPPLVMLDPGHGGRDPGAIGIGGAYEKHVALAAAETLRDLLAASGRCRVALTRDVDRFVKLEDRVEMARARGAALFASMHADAIGDPRVAGASVYTLAVDASDAQSAALARRENAAGRAAGDAPAASPDVARILAGLVRRETRLGSARLQNDMVGALGRDLPLLHDPARHAGFAVLRAEDVPSILVEMGFMSNPRDEALLRRPEYRLRIARAMARAVDSFLRARAAT